MISKPIQHLLNTVVFHKTPDYLVAKPGEPVIKVGELVSQAALFYEKIRYTVDYQEEHLLRRSAIERMLRRRLVFDFKHDKIAGALVVELIRAGYLPNNVIPERIVGYVQAIIDKALVLSEAILKDTSSIIPATYKKRIVSIAATEIEAFLFPHPIQEAAVSAFYNTIRTRLKIPDTDLTPNARNIQIYIACRRSLLKNDDDTLFYRLWLLYYPNWTKMRDRKEVEGLAKGFLAMEHSILDHLNHDLNRRLVPKLRNHAIYFTFIEEIARESGPDAEDLFADTIKLQSETRKLAEKNYKREFDRVKKSAWRALIYVFITKIALGVMLELPYDYLLINEINYLAFGINIIFHPLLLFVITSNIVMPGGENTNRIIAAVNGIVYNQRLKNILVPPKKRRSILSLIVLFVYTVVFILTFGAIVWVLQWLNFNIVGGGLFLLFLTFVSYFGLRIRYNSRRWLVTTSKENMSSFFWDMFTLPIVLLGRWLTKKFDAVNVFVFVLDFIIETPFKLVLEVLDSFSSFLREKKEQIY